MSIQTLKNMTDYSVSVLRRCLEGMSDEQALQPLFEGGGHANWLVGHLVTSMNDILELLGAERTRAKEVDDLYDYGSKAAGGHSAPPLAQQLADLDRVHALLNTALDGLSEEQLAQPSGNRNRTLQQRLEFSVWHLAYHIGQAMLYRRAVGLDSPIG